MMGSTRDMPGIPHNSATPPRSHGRFNAEPPAFDPGPFDPVQAFKWSFEVYRTDLVKVALPVVVLETAALFATLILPRLAASALRSVLGVVPPQQGFDAIAVAQHLVGVLLGIMSFAYVATCLYPYLLNLARGRPVDFAEVFRPGPHLVKSVLLAAIIFIAQGLGLSLCILPGIATFAFTATAFPALLDRDLDVVTALRESFGQARAHPMPFVIFGLLSIAITLIGAALCIVGAVLVSVPVVMLAQIFVYLRMEGEVPVGMDLA
jgi:hypothetical protein